MNDIKRQASMISMEQGTLAAERAGLVSALQEAENEGLPPPRPAFTKKITLAGKVASFFRGEYVMLTANGDMTLEQLYRRLRVAAAKDRLALTKFEEMMFVMASDIRKAKAFPQAGMSPGIARPMSAWRERYNGLDRSLPE